jgi:hypothetical protein
MYDRMLDRVGLLGGAAVLVLLGAPCLSELPPPIPVATSYACTDPEAAAAFAAKLGATRVGPSNITATGCSAHAEVGVETGRIRHA